MKYKPTGRPVGATLTTTTLTTSETKVFSYIAPYRIRLTELSIFGDANFVANGLFKVTINGEVITGTQAARGYISLNSATQGVTKPWQNSEIYLERNAEVAVHAYAPTSTATMSVDMTGEQVEEN